MSEANPDAENSVDEKPKPEGNKAKATQKTEAARKKNNGKSGQKKNSTGAKDKKASKKGKRDNLKKRPKNKKGKKKRKKRKKKKPRCPIKRRKKAMKRKCTDMLAPDAVLNSYYTCHGVPDMLKLRKFKWSKKKGK